MSSSARRLAALFVFALLAFCPPVVLVFNQPGTVFGLPLFPAYLFAVWTGLTLFAWLLSRGRSP